MADGKIEHDVTDRHGGRAMTMPRVTAVVLNWQRCGETIRCVESIRSMTYPNFDIVIVDNASADGSEQILRTRFPDVKIVQAGANLGYAGGNNRGIAEALRSGVDYVMVLNNDTTVDPNCLAEIVAVATSDHSVGAIAPKIYRAGRQNRLWSVGGYIDWWRGTAELRGAGEWDNGQYDTINETERVAGAAFLASSEALTAAGSLAEDYFLYWEEVDWSVELKRAGYRILTAPRAKIWHQQGASTGGDNSSNYLYYSTRNCLLFMRRHATRLQLVTATMYRVYLSVRAVCRVRIRHGGRLRGAIGAVVGGLADFGRGKTGARVRV